MLLVEEEILKSTSVPDWKK